MTRRQLLYSLTAAAGSAAVVFPKGQTLRAGVQTSAWKLRDDDFPALLKVLSEINSLGYEGFETGSRNVQGMFGKKSKEAAEQIAATGLRFIGCHIFLGNYDAKSNIPPMDQIAEVVEGAASLGAERLILSGSPVADEGSPMDSQRLLWKAGALNRAGRSGYDNRIRVCYHNHGPEFASGAEEITALMKETDNDVVHFVLDAGDAIRAKADIAAFFSKYHKRIDGLHLRDFNAKDVQVPLGQGTFQYEPLALAVKKAKWVGWVIAEEERDNGEKPGEAAARPAREQIRKLFGV